MKQKTLAFITAIILSTLSFSAQASTPRIQVYNVTNIKAGDSLNIRAEPNSSAAIQLSIPNDTEVLSTGETKKVDTTTWIRVSLGAVGGWVNKKYLKTAPHLAQLSKTNEDTTKALKCHGTEPFWNLDFKGNTLQLEQVGEKKITTTITERRKDKGDNHYIFAGKTELYIRGDDAGGVCDDGMSDQSYPLHINILKADNTFLTGCCTN
jgi:uncharacterized membrane protein